MTMNELIAYRNDVADLRDRLSNQWYNAHSSSDLFTMSRDDFLKCIESVARCAAFLEELDVELPDISAYMPGK